MNIQMLVICMNLKEIKYVYFAIKQLKIYVDNNNKIKGLKEDQINLSRNKFWLYFGG